MDRQSFIERMMPFAIEASRETGVDPRIILGQAALESAWGTKAPGNNLFGIKSHGEPGGQTFTTHEVIDGRRVKTQDSFRSYGSPEESFRGYADFINRNPRYRTLKGTQGLEDQARALQASGYATDPKYGQKVLSIAQGIPSIGQAPAAPQIQQQAPRQIAQGADRHPPNPTGPRNIVPNRLASLAPKPGPKIDPKPSGGKLFDGGKLSSLASIASLFGGEEEAPLPQHQPVPTPEPVLLEVPDMLQRLGYV